MRVTFVLDHAGLAGGVRVVAIHAERLRRRGHKVCIVSRRYRFPRRRDRARDLVRRLGWNVRGRQEPSHLNDVEAERIELPGGAIPTDRDVPDADVIVATWWETAEWVSRLSSSKGAKAYFLQHYEVHQGQPIERVKATWRLPLHKIVVSGWLADLARDVYDDPDATVVPNSVDLVQFSARRRKKQAVPTFGLMYHRARYKGVDICLEALARARRARPDMKLIAFGAEPPSRDLPLPADATYTLQPPQHHLREIYGQCDAWLFGSRSEGFGLPILEAMACRTPVIAAPAGAAPELLAGGRGLLLRKADPTEMADAMLALADMSPADWSAMSSAAWSHARSYTWDDATQRFERALETAVGRGAGRSIFAGAIPAPDDGDDGESAEAEPEQRIELRSIDEEPDEPEKEVRLYSIDEEVERADEAAAADCAPAAGLDDGAPGPTGPGAHAPPRGSAPEAASRPAARPTIEQQALALAAEARTLAETIKAERVVPGRPKPPEGPYWLD